MENLREKVVDDAQQRCRQIGGDIGRTSAARQHHLEELGGRGDVASLRHKHIDDLAVLVHRSVHVPPHSGNSDVRLIHEPPVADTVAAWPSRLDDERREALHPSVDGDVINLHAAFREQLLNVAVRQAVAQVPPDGQ